MMRITLILLLALTALLALVSCTPAPQTPKDPASLQMPPLRVCVMQDLTGSIVETRTPRISEKELRLLLEPVMARGGELGFGVIQERSDRVLLRFAVESAPPEVPPQPANPLDLDSWKEEAGKVEAQRKAWEAILQARTDRFLKQIQARLQERLAPATDVCGAIRRCDLMLAEPSDSPTANFLILISDGQHNVRSSACPESITAKTRLLLVNGAGVLGILERYQPLRFESIEAAIRYVAKSPAEGDRGGHGANQTGGQVGR